jgi:hypothetical protein
MKVVHLAAVLQGPGSSVPLDELPTDLEARHGVEGVRDMLGDEVVGVEVASVLDQGVAAIRG